MHCKELYNNLLVPLKKNLGLSSFSVLYPLLQSIYLHRICVLELFSRIMSINKINGTKSMSSSKLSTYYYEKLLSKKYWKYKILDILIWNYTLLKTFGGQFYMHINSKLAIPLLGIFSMKIVIHIFKYGCIRCCFNIVWIRKKTRNSMTKAK